MKINDDTLFPHPVLNNETDDYRDSEFTCEFRCTERVDSKLEIESTFKLKNEYLNRLLVERKVSSGYIVVCRESYFNRLQHVPLGKTQTYFEMESMFRTILVRALLWTTERIGDFHHDSINEEFETPVEVLKGSVVALGPEKKILIDRLRFKPFESIFKLSVSDTISPNVVKVDAQNEKVEILADAKTRDRISSLRAQNKNILLSSLYLPVVMEILSVIRDGDSDLGGLLWYRVFMGKCEEQGIDPKNASKPVIEVAQELLHSPLRGILENLEFV